MGHAYPFAETSEYRPLTYLSYWAQVQTTGNRILPLKGLNLLLHLCNGMMVYLIFRRLFNLRIAQITAFIFCVHPLATESVANVTGRADLLALLFALLAWQADLNRRDANVRTKWQFRCLCILSCVAASLCKESGISILAALFLCDLCLRGSNTNYQFREAFRQQLVNWLALPLALLIRLLMRGGVVFGEPPSFIDNPIIQANGSQQLLTAGWVNIKALALFILPYPQSVDYSYDQIPLVVGASDFRSYLVVLFFIFSTLLVGWIWVHKKKSAFFTITALASSYFVTSNYVVVIGTIFGERTLYMPLVFMSLGITLLFSQRLKITKFNRILGALCVVWVAMLPLRTFSRNLIWSDYEVFLAKHVQYAPDSARTWKRVALYHRDKQQWHDCLAASHKGIHITSAWSELWSIAGLAEAMMGNNAEAANAYAQAIYLGERQPEIVEQGIGLMVNQLNYQDVKLSLSILLSVRPNLEYEKWWLNANQLANCDLSDLINEPVSNHVAKAIAAEIKSMDLNERWQWIEDFEMASPSPQIQHALAHLWSAIDPYEANNWSGVLNQTPGLPPAYLRVIEAF